MSLDIPSPRQGEAETPAQPCCGTRAETAVPASPKSRIEVELPTKSCCSTRAEARPAPASQAALMTLLSCYQPIFVIAGAALGGSVMLAAASHDGAMLGERLMGGFMGLFLLPLALLKLFDTKGFAASFARYDILAKAWPPYARAYPYVELALALLFLSGLFPVATNLAAIAIGVLGTVGIVRSLSRGEQLRCACVGSVIDVPLGGVSITENAGMAIMAALMLAM
jgi:hypothetical protein